jgi:hypothetical protein
MKIMCIRQRQIAFRLPTTLIYTTRSSVNSLRIEAGSTLAETDISRKVLVLRHDWASRTIMSH